MYTDNMWYEPISQSVFVHNIWCMVVVSDKNTKNQYLLWFKWAAFGSIVLTSAVLLAIKEEIGILGNEVIVVCFE